MSHKTTGTAWAIPMESGRPALQAMRGTFTRDGAFVMARGGQPVFDPEQALYLTSDMVDNIVAKGHVRIDGDTCSGQRLFESMSLHAWKQGMSLVGLKAHAHLGKTIPSIEVIRNAHQARLEAAKSAEV